jgi:L,D-peptidoglycan transpeptidase YkuD (ErfK/YbiS/YcfS/YnhG family)
MSTSSEDLDLGRKNQLPSSGPLIFNTGVHKSEKHSYFNIKCGDKSYPCVVGINGIKNNKQEGDGATPEGNFPLRRVWYRADRVNDLITDLPTKIIRPDDGWCDDPTSLFYNKPVKIPFNKSHEDLWRKDNLYDIFLEIGYNDEPAISGKGSAIFMHIARPDFSPTAGCVAVTLDNLKEILKKLDTHSEICISGIGLSVYEAPKLQHSP